jgi:clan AA aspartic protease
MIQGRVNQQLEVVIPVLALNSANGTITIDASIDTGFNGELTLRLAQIALLGLSHPSFVVVQLADGTIRQQQVYSARLNWDGLIRVVRVIQIESKPLVGVRLLEGYRLVMDAVVGGQVTIEPIP